jgi:excisionase family DNA binding protein
LSIVYCDGKRRKGKKMMTEMKALAYRPNQAAAALGIGRDKLFELLAAGEIRSFREGRTRIIPANSLQEYIDRRMAEGS